MQMQKIKIQIEHPLLSFYQNKKYFDIKTNQIIQKLGKVRTKEEHKATWSYNFPRN